MELGSFFLVLAVIVIIGVYLYAPFTMGAYRVRKSRLPESNEISALKAERDRTINSLQELDFDFKLGKIPAEDYPDQRASLLQKGADVLRKLDELVPVSASDMDAEKRIEKATVDSRTDDEDIEAMIATRRKEQKSKSAGFCPKCGKPVLASDKFCASCGKAL